MEKGNTQRGILVGAINGARLYYMLNAPGGNADGLTIDSDGRSRAVDFAKTAAYEMGLRKFVTSPFHEFIWGAHTGDDLALWTSIFMTKTRPIPDEMLKGVPIKEDFTPAIRKKKTVDKKAQDFKKRQHKKALRSQQVINSDIEELNFKSIGRSIRRMASSGSFDPSAYDADADGFVQDGTPWMRPAVRPSLPGMRSATTSKVADEKIEQIRSLISPEKIQELYDLVDAALNLGTTRRTVAVSIDDYGDIDFPAFMEIRDINPATKKRSGVIRLGSDQLMEVERHSHRVGQAVIALAKERTDLDMIRQKWDEKISEVNDKFVRLSGIKIKAADTLGLRWYESKTGKIVPNLRLEALQPPKDKRLLALHGKLLGQIKESNKQKNEDDKIVNDIKALLISPQVDQTLLSDIQKRLEKAGINEQLDLTNQDSLNRIARSLEERMNKWRDDRDEIYATYERAVISAFDKESAKLGGPEYDQLETEAAQLLLELREQKSQREALFEEIKKIFEELGVTYGNEKLSLQLPRRNATEEDRVFSSAAKEIGDHASATASKHIPDVIIAKINKLNKPKGLKIKKADPGSGHLGLWNRYARTLETDGRESTTVHELIHAASDSDPLLDVLQQLILSSRWVGYKDEKSREKGLQALLRRGWQEPKKMALADGEALLVEDEFEDIYAGRIYPDGVGAETLTRAFDYLLDPTFREYGNIDYDLLASAFGGLLMVSLGSGVSTWS